VALLALVLGMLSCEGEKRPYTAPMRDTLAATPAAGGATGTPTVIVDNDAAALCEEGELEFCGPETSEGLCEFGFSQMCSWGLVQLRGRGLPGRA